MNLGKTAAILASLTLALSGMVTFAACGDDDDDNTGAKGASGAKGAGGGGGASGGGGAGGGTDSAGKLTGTVNYTGTEKGFLEVLVFTTTDPTKFGGETIRGLANVNTPAYPQTFTIENIAPGHYYIFCKINVGPTHTGLGPDDESCTGGYDGSSWDVAPIEVDITAGQTTTLSSPLKPISQDGGEAGAGGGGGAGGAPAGAGGAGGA